MKKHFYVMLSFMLSIQISTAQVAKTVVVEHFTNTRCSVCASRNPGFYSNLNKQTGVLHIAIHPSSPYPTCVLNKQNKVENDARTNYYGIYGSTPRLVIQGVVIDGVSDYGDQSLFNPYLNQTSPLQISTKITDESPTTVRVDIVVKTVSAHTLGQLVLTTSAVEEELNYVAPNGEQKQYDVFRKSVLGTNGEVFTAPAVIGDSIIFTASITKSTDWTLNQLYALSMVQEVANKQMVQANRSGLLVVTQTTGLQNTDKLNVSIYPNPAQHTLNIKLGDTQPTLVSVYNIAGVEVLNTTIQYSAALNVESLPNGLYFVSLRNSNSSSLVKINIIQ